MTDTPPHSAETGKHSFKMGPILGAGAFGEVYLATMRTGHDLTQRVALKLLAPGLDPRSQSVERMKDEGRMLGYLEHPAILGVMDFCVLDGRLGLVMEYVAGSDLEHAIQSDDPIPWRAAASVIGIVADALDAAWRSTDPRTGHPMNLVHRDIKPANIRLTPHGTVKVLDFGIAKAETPDREAMTQQRAAIGTPAYMAPEVLSYEVLDALPSRDVFALGCTLYECLAGERFFEGLEPEQIGRLSMREERFQSWRTGRISRIARQHPRLVELCSRMLRHDHTQRPTAREVADTCLELAEAGGDGETLRAWARRHRWPEPGEKQGSFTGRTLADSAVASSVSSQSGSWGAPQALGAAATMDFDGQVMGNETLVPHGGDGTMLVERGPGATVVQTPDRLRASAPTMEVAPPPGAAPSASSGQQVVVERIIEREVVRTKKRGPSISRILSGGFSLFVVAAAGLFFYSPARFERLMGGDVTAFLPSGLPGVELPGLGGGSAPVGDGRTGIAWGAGATGAVATIKLSGDAQVLLARPGQSDLQLLSGNAVEVPPGRVIVRAKFGTLGAWTDQVDAQVNAGETLRVQCDPAEQLCYRF